MGTFYRPGRSAPDMFAAVIRLIVFLLACLSLAGCTSSAYYMQAVRGHMDLMDRRVPVETVLADPATPPAVKARLEVARDARAFAVTELALPDNGSYTSYVRVDGRAVVWNVYAAGEFSLTPKTWCFPVAGCVVYRGYFHEEDARRYARELAADGFDTWVGGAAAYSTLGRFEDPVVSTMLAWDDARLASTLFHELAHQRLYVKGDSAFNEAFATAVAEEGVERWLRATGREDQLAGWRTVQARTREFESLLAATRSRLEALYASGEPAPAMRDDKAAAFAGLEAGYAKLREHWGGWGGYDRWFDEPLNNARLIPSATYRRWVPAFDRLLEESGGDLRTFYERCEALAELDPAARAARLERLIADAGSAPSPPGAPR